LLQARKIDLLLPIPQLQVQLGLDEHRATAATTRVLIDSTDGKRVWGAVGVGENIIEASWQALVDELEYGVNGATKD
jgi:2-isopropylmalate synthase